MDYDDKDMKIVGDPSAQKLSDDYDVIGSVKSAHEQRINGNIAKAAALGSQIVSAFTYADLSAAPSQVTDLIDECGVVADEALIEQIKLLTIFTAEYSIRHYITQNILSEAAIQRAYDVLQENYPEIYDLVCKAVAFSFYYLSSDHKEHISSGIGRDFAMLCKHRGDERYEKLGSELYKMYKISFKKAIASFVFV